MRRSALPNLVPLVALLLAFASPARAQETEPGDPCPTAGLFRTTGGAENPDGHLVFCNGSTWQTILGYSSAGGWVMLSSAGLAAAPLHVEGEAIIRESGLACAAPAAGALRYTSAGEWEYCDGATWTGLSGDPEQLSGLAAPASSETDPQVGTLTNGKWCTSDGSLVNCTSSGPICTQRTATSSSASHTVSCNAGEIMMGGGCRHSSSTARIEDSGPSAAATWTCEWDTAASTSTAYAICCAF